MAQKPVSEFDKPLDTWVEEEVEIPAFEPVVDEKNNRVEFKRTTKKAIQKTFYSEGTTSKLVCAPGQHHYFPLDKGKYLFGCTKCTWKRFAYPTSYKFDPETGQLTHRITGEPV